jgi:hypothetical protein
MVYLVNGDDKENERPQPNQLMDIKEDRAIRLSSTVQPKAEKKDKEKE